MRVVLDTNILVRAVSQSGLLLISSLTFELVIGTLNLLPNVIRSEVYYDLQLIYQDVDDDKFVNCAFATNAHCIVTDDRHFNILDKIPFPKITVLKLVEFKKIMTDELL